MRFRGSLDEHDPSDKPQNKRRKKLTGDVPADSLESLQERLWAESTAGGRRAILLLLQGIDTAGKGGVTNHVVGVCKPIGVQYTAFKKPTDEELRHDFLWRIRPHVPHPGVIGVFDRSHYEDVLVPLVHELLPASEIDARYRQIAEFEASLVASEVDGGQVLPAHLERACSVSVCWRGSSDPDKHWKFQRVRHRRAGALAALLGRVRRDAAADVHRRRAVVRRPGRSQEVPELGGRPRSCWRRCGTWTRSTRVRTSTSRPSAPASTPDARPCVPPLTSRP